MIISLTEQAKNEQSYGAGFMSAALEAQTAESNADSAAHELGMWLCALKSFFNIRNLPLNQAEPSSTFDWTVELRILRRCLLRASKLVLDMSRADSFERQLLNGDESSTLSLMAGDETPRALYRHSDRSLNSLAESISDVVSLCESLLAAQSVNLQAWSSFGRFFARLLETSDAARRVMHEAEHEAAASLQPQLAALTRGRVQPTALAADVLYIFNALAKLLWRLRFIESELKRDAPLKQTLPIFCLVHEESRRLREFIETRAMRVEGLSENILEALDGSNYALAMELRKVFAHELVGLSALRQAPPIYAKVETAHGLLRDCFQHSTLALAQVFDPALDGARLFSAFHTKLEQSLVLRSDLWTLSQLVRRAEHERDLFPIARLLEQLNAFREGSLRYLMYKDWEGCERFMEEVATARGAVELAPVLNRFGAYLETLHGQVNMRAVLANHPFDFPQVEI